MLNDVRLAMRSLLRAPGFTITTVLSLALAAAANAAIFAVVNSVLLKPLPYREPDRLVAVWPQQFQSNDHLEVTRARGGMFSHVASIAPGWTMSLSDGGEPTKVTVGRVSGNLFETLGVPAMLGQAFSEGAARKGNDAVVVLSHALWQRRFGSDPTIIGRPVTLDGAPVTIVAVMPPTFDVLGLRSDAYTPLTLDAGAWYHRLSFSLFLGRLAPGLSVEQAERDYRALMQALRVERKYPDDFARTAAVADLRTAMTGDARASLVLLGAAVAFILLIAAANVGTLQLTRAAARSRDLAIRSALGASRRQLVRQLLVENLVVAAGAAAAGVLTARMLLPLLLAILPDDTPRLAEITIDPLVAALVMLGTVAVGLMVALTPALGITRQRTEPLLRSTRSTEGRGAKRTRAILVAVEVALAVVLTIGAALMVQTLARLHAVDPGFKPGGVLTLHVQPTGAKYRGMVVADYYDRLLERLRGVAGVSEAGAIQHLPFSGYSWTSPLEVEGQSVPAGGRLPTVEARVVTPRYFEAIGQPVVAGRAIERADATRPDVVVVNEALAVTFFGSAQAALGRRMRTRGGMGPGPQMTVVGVVGNVRHTALTSEAGPETYNSVAKNTIPAMMLAIRTDGDPGVLAAAVREAIRSVDRDVPLSAIQSMDAKIAASLGQPRLLFRLLVSFAAIGVLLAVIGVYGVVAYSVTQRWRELGIMTALGAQRERIVRTVLREALAYGIAGLALGIPAALVASRLMTTVVWGVSATDPLTYAAIAVATLAIVTVASLLPALRAARVDPVAALKSS